MSYGVGHRLGLDLALPREGKGREGKGREGKHDSELEVHSSTPLILITQARG